MLPIVLVVGPSGGGKSALCQRVRDLAHARGVPPAGILTAQRRMDTAMTGLDAINAASGQHLPLAELDRPTGGPTTGRWHFHDDTIAQAIAWCRAVTPDGLVVIDEVGPLELVQQCGWAPLMPWLAEHAGPAIVSVRPTLVDTLSRLLLPRESVRVVVTPSTREQAYFRTVSVLGLDA